MSGQSKVQLMQPSGFQKDDDLEMRPIVESKSSTQCKIWFGEIIDSFKLGCGHEFWSSWLTAHCENLTEKGLEMRCKVCNETVHQNIIDQLHNIEIILSTNNYLPSDRQNWKDYYVKCPRFQCQKYGHFLTSDRTAKWECGYTFWVICSQSEHFPAWEPEDLFKFNHQFFPTCYHKKCDNWSGFFQVTTPVSHYVCTSCHKDYCPNCTAKFDADHGEWDKETDLEYVAWVICLIVWFPVGCLYLLGRYTLSVFTYDDCFQNLKRFNSYHLI